MDELRKTVVKADEESKKNALPSASYGYGGKFGIEKDRMDKVKVRPYFLKWFALN